MTDDQDDKLQRALDAGLELFGAGVAGVLGAVAGGDLAAATIASMTGTGITNVGKDIVSRVLSPRQTARVGGVFVQAARAISAHEALGFKVRDDGFWDGDRSNGAEFAEGVFLAATNTFEEKKIPYLGNVIANVAIDTQIDAATANLAIRLSTDLSWLEMCLISIFMRPGEFPIPEGQRRTPVGWNDWTVKTALDNLISESRGFLLYPRQKGKHGIALFDLNLNAIELSARGNLVASTMELADIPATELTTVYERIFSGKVSSEQ
jgi:hypothetical protein